MADNLNVKDAAGATKTILMNEITVDAVLGLVQRVMVINGTSDVSDSNPMPIDDAGGTISVDDGAGSLTVDGTVTVQDGGGSITVDGIVSVSAVAGTVAVGGSVAHDAADSGNPVKVGGKASSTAPSDVANGDRVDAYFDLKGRVGTFAAGDTAHDAADTGNPLKVGGKARTSAPAAVTDGDRVDAYFDANGRLAVHDGGVALEVAGDVNAVAQGDTPHDAADGGNPVKIGGKASAALPSAVTNGDRVDAYFDRNGRQVIYADALGEAADAVVEGDVAGSMSAKLRGLQKVIGAVADAAASGAVSISAKLRYLTTNLGTQADAQAYGVTDGSIFGKLKGIAGGIGALDVVASGGDTDGSVIAKLKALNVTIEAVLNADRQTVANSLSTVRAASGATGRYNGSAVDGHGTDPILYSKTDDISTATTVIPANLLAANFILNDDIYLYIPMRQYKRLTIALTNNLNRDVAVTLYGYLQRDGTTTQKAVQLVTATSNLSGTGSLIFGQAAMATGGSADYVAIPNLWEHWDYVALKLEVVASTATTGSVQLLVSRDLN